MDDACRNKAWTTDCSVAIVVCADRNNFVSATNKNTVRAAHARFVGFQHRLARLVLSRCVCVAVFPRNNNVVEGLRFVSGHATDIR